ncbi:UDP-glucose 4-epimerase [Pantoea ananatis]|uniref:UDP-glucose 4-epimerase GalE n=1 Tax=Pantoea ananas TaxID=553 RepID=UPI000B7EE962|nr:UDP-glucose 4-epimerase GalE [Pantoea ananatis]AWQ20719.1 UDP-glucose 4-epimerase GalE [Pantoea ananatis]MBN6032674.1 UDP-glucose 4-epimerase GalE [Pantoea ananatis]MCK0555673.1 UDP-glucose 4-epimerase GalE [Pantoea ananatis]MCW0318689.1 UDP-glucose 4-epimerase [Pantoea ananatis]MCW0336866.1 UDP-glucose 4-epimerase [Pantoea ananatis]
MAILVTGGAGYIGSHTVLTLLEQGNEVVVLDNLCNASREAIIRVEQLSGKPITFYQIDVRDAGQIRSIFSRHTISAVIHFAGLKSVSESLSKPLEYYDNNLNSTLIMLHEMRRAGVKKLIFSSSATVYGQPEFIPLTENARIGGTTNPYGTSKLMIEQILQDCSQANPDLTIIILRYFNPVGAHPSGQIGEDPNGIPANLVPYITQVAVGKLEKLSVFGDDYPTKDGTGVRDYIHVMDVAEGHIKALESIDNHHGVAVYNLGTGIGYSVKEILHAFEEVSGQSIPYEIVPRRAGDIGECWSDPSLAKKQLGWQAKRSLNDMVRDAWHWQVNNPQGFES